MRALLAMGAVLVADCVLARTRPDRAPEPIHVLSRSHNAGDVRVYVLCGERDARWLGVVASKGAESFEVPAGEARCVRGLNFFLVVNDRGRGYWVGPVRPNAGDQVDLVIEKYAGLSTASVIGAVGD